MGLWSLAKSQMRCLVRPEDHHCPRCTYMCCMYNARMVFPVADPHQSWGGHYPCSRPLLCGEKVEASHQPARPSGGNSPALTAFSLVGWETPGYKWRHLGVWLQRQRGSAAAAAVEVSAMIVIRGLLCSFWPAWSCWPGIQMPLVIHTHTHVHTLKSRTLA